MSASLAPLPDGFATTVASLHRVAEKLLAPARKPDNEIALRPTPGGFGTPEFELGGARRQVRVEGVELVQEVDGRTERAPLRSLRGAAGVVAELLPDRGEGLDEEPLTVDPAAAAALAAWYRLGEEALRALAADASAEQAATEPILWPEHFDIAIELGSEAAGERATYGLSPGDADHPEPYAYVGPWREGIEGELWRATGFKGAELGYAEMAAADDTAAALSEFFQSRRRALGSDPS